MEEKVLKKFVLYNFFQVIRRYFFPNIVTRSLSIRLFERQYTRFLFLFLAHCNFWQQPKGANAQSINNMHKICSSMKGKLSINMWALTRIFRGPNSDFHRMTTKRVCNLSYVLPKENSIINLALFFFGKCTFPVIYPVL